MSSCRSSGIKTSSAIIVSGRCKLVSVHGLLTGSAATTIKVFDNTSASGKELVRVTMGDTSSPTSPYSFEFDMHGVIANTGLYLDIETGTNKGAAVSVEFN